MVDGTKQDDSKRTLGEAQRQFSRVRVSRSVRYCIDGDDARFQSAPARNISMGGMFICTTKPHPVGTKVYLQFALESGDIVAEGWGRVSHVSEQGKHEERGMGIEFVNIDDDNFIAAHEIALRIPRKHARHD